MDSVLITGGTGFLGQIIKSRFNNITSLGRDTKNDLICDLSTEIPDLKNDYEVIIHAAGKAHSVPRSEEEVNEFYAVNFEGTKNLCLAIDKLDKKPKSFIFISTVSVYGLDAGQRITEDYPLNGQTPYAKSKILAENFLIDWAKQHNVILSILRLPLIAGTNAPGNLGAMIQGIKSGKYLSIGKADARKSMVWADDIAAIIPKLNEIGGVFNLTDGQHPSFKELELIISMAFQKKRPITIPILFAKLLGITGDVIGGHFPINSNKLKKITSPLTFDDEKAVVILDWKPSSVLDKLSETL